MEVYIKETLHVLDYKDNAVGIIFNSEDHRTAGYAFNISITEANTGYSDLKFEMPNMILNDKGDQVRNPLQNLMTPLVKLRYRREVYYTGERPISVREPQGYGDTVVYVNKTYSNTYPDNLIEDYIMDYIVQPVDTKRDVLKTTTTYTAIDYPRFNLSKKRVGLTIDKDNTLTKPEWSIYENKPLDEPGVVKYVQWNTDLSQSAGNPDIPLVWDPEHAHEYPLKKEDIVNLMANSADWPYGLLATCFYWPITSTARFEGTLYKKNGYLVLQIIDFYNISTEGIDPSLYVERYSWDWTQIYEIQPLLCPNNALNYLRFILEGTNWSIALRPDGVTPDVDIVKTVVPNPKGSTESTEEVDLTSNVTVSGSNCYNAITETCKALQLYPVFDCINRTVALRQFAGKNYGLTYALGKNLKDNSTKADGEKVITKLYCTGGKDYNGDADINIGRAERAYMKTLNGFYRSSNDLPTPYYIIKCSNCGYEGTSSTAVSECPECHETVDPVYVGVEGYWAIVDPDIPASSFEYTDYRLEEINNRAEIVPYTIQVHDERVSQYWVSGENRSVYFWDGTQWNPGTKLPSGNWEGAVAGQTVVVDPETGDSGEWSPNEDMYINSRSPYGTNYILNLKWAYYNKWISKEQILELYQYEKKINDLNEEFMDKYWEDYRKTQILYYEAVNNYDIAQEGYEATLYAMESKYYNEDKVSSKGYTYCFHKLPQGTYERLGKAYIKLFHCFDCHHSCAVDGTTLVDPTGNEDNYTLSGNVCPLCNSTDIQIDEIYIPAYDDFEFEYEPEDYPYGDQDYSTGEGRLYGGYQYNPHLKGYFFKLCMSLDRSNSDWTIGDYEQRVSLIKGIPMEDRDVILSDGYIYKLDGVYVRSTSGQIEVWNNSILDYITNYGKMLEYLREVNEMLARLKKLEEIWEQWHELIDNLNAAIQLNFGDYLIEGNYINKDQPFINLLFKEGLEASDKYSTPEITYNLNVIDSSGLIEYREPTITNYHCTECGYMTHDIIHRCPRCNSEHVDVENDVYNDLVKMLHSTGQIVPKAGDYVAIYDEPMGMFGVPGLITQITRYPDNPINNKIELNTSYTDDEELVGNIITATNTVLNNSDIYARTAVLKADGTLDETSIRESLDNSNANITIVGTNGNILLDGSGLRATDPMDASRAMKYAGNGIFNTSNLDNPTGDPVVWEKMMSPSGINANYINSGSIDTNKLTITSGLSGKVVLDQYGLSVKNTASKVNHVTRFNKEEAKANSEYVRQWGTNNNLAVFSGVDPDNNPLIYTKGFLAAEEGSNIANWITSNDGFYKLSGNNPVLWLSPSGNKPLSTGDHKATVNGISDNYTIYSNGNFGVNTNGNMVASGANITGKIVVTDNSSTVNNGKVGGWQSTDNGLINSSTNTKLVLSPAGGAITGTVHDSGSRSDWGIFMNSKFGVTTNGDVYMTSAHVRGDIYADSGTFNGTINTTNMNASGNVTINNASITNAAITNGTINSATLSSCSISAAQINSGVLNVARIPDLSADKIKAGTVNASSVEFKTSEGYLTVGTNTKHPSVSGLNVGANGVLFGSQASNTSITGNSSNINLTYGGGGIFMGANGGDTQVSIQTGGVTVHSTINMAGVIKAGGKTGQTTGSFKVDDVGTGYYLLDFTYGILTTFENHH